MFQVLPEVIEVKSQYFRVLLETDFQGLAETKLFGSLPKDGVIRRRYGTGYRSVQILNKLIEDADRIGCIAAENQCRSVVPCYNLKSSWRRQFLRPGKEDSYVFISQGCLVSCFLQFIH